MSSVGIVLISHSHKVVEGMRDIIRQVIHHVPLEIAGGTETNEIGTSVTKIHTAIEKANSDKGVLLFYDLGSAKMNAELVLEMGEYKNVKIVEAPLLEGAYVAAVESNMGKQLDEIIEVLDRTFTIHL